MQKLSTLLSERVSALLCASPKTQEILQEAAKVSELQIERIALLDQVYALTQRHKEQASLIDEHNIAQEN